VTKSFVQELQIERARRYRVGGLCEAVSVCLQESGVIGVDADVEQQVFRPEEVHEGGIDGDGIATGASKVQTRKEDAPQLRNVQNTW